MGEITACLFVDRTVWKRGPKIMWEEVRMTGFMFFGPHVVMEALLDRCWECPLLRALTVVEL